MNRLRPALCLLAAALVLTPACTRKKPEPSRRSEAPPPQKERPADRQEGGTRSEGTLGAITGPAAIDVFVLSAKPGAPGAVVRDRRAFRTGETLLVSVIVRNAGPATRLKVAWNGSDGKTLTEEERPAASRAALVFEAKGSEGWKKGEFWVVAWVGSEKQQAVKFRIQ